MSKKSIINELIAATEADLSLAKSVSAISKKARFFSDQLEVLRTVQKGMDGPLIFKVADLKKYMDTKSLGVLETRWNKVLDKRRAAREEAEEEKRQQDETSQRERERIKQAAQDAVVREHEAALEKLRQERAKPTGRGPSGFTDPLTGDTELTESTSTGNIAVDLTDDLTDSAAAPSQVPAPSAAPAISSFYPKSGTAAHELLLAMSSIPNPATKDQIVKVTGPGKAWGGLQKLKTEGMAIATKVGSLSMYSLTPAGQDLAKKLGGGTFSQKEKRLADDLREDLERQKRPKNTSRVDIHGRHVNPKQVSLPPEKPWNRYAADEDMDVHVVPMSSGATVAAAELRKAGLGVSNSEVPEVTWEPSSYEVVLIVDKRENNREEAQQAISGLTQKNITVVPSVLYLGDFLFAARHKTSKKIAVLNTIIERKRYDDLNSSIVDSRYEEQKSRLRKCGVENVIYLVEHYSMARASVQHRDKAIASILGRVVAIDGFLLKKTKNVLDSCDYMASLYESVRECYKNVTLSIGTKEIGGFSELRDTFSTMMLTAWQDKNLKSNHSLKVLFIQMLMTINGISAERAEAIQRLFPTPHHLIDGYRKMGETEGKGYLELHTRGEIRNVGKAASEMVWEIFGKL